MNSTTFPHQLAAKLIKQYLSSDDVMDFVGYAKYLHDSHTQLQEENRELKSLVEIQKQEIKFLQDNEYTLTGYKHK